MNSAMQSLIALLSCQPGIQHITVFKSDAKDGRGHWQASIKSSDNGGYRIAYHDKPAHALLKAFGPMPSEKRLPFVPRHGARVHFWSYTQENGQTVRRRVEGTVIDRFESAALHSALCCVRVPGDKSAGQWMSARFVSIIARRS